MVNGIVFASQAKDNRGQIFKSTDNGLTWTTSSKELFNINKNYYRPKNYDNDWSTNKELRPVTHLLVHNKFYTLMWKVMEFIYPKILVNRGKKSLTFIMTSVA